MSRGHSAAGTGQAPLRPAIRAVCGQWWRTLVARPGLLRWPFYAVRFWQEWLRYRKLAGTELPRPQLADCHPCLAERTAFTQPDPHCLFQGIWALRHILRRTPARHVDVGSDNRWVGWLTVHIPVVSIDIRPLAVQVPNLECRGGSVLDLPFEDASVGSLSCLHVVEHVGLGRYGDPLDPAGTTRACRELSRVLAPGGSLYLSMPVGRPRVCFNAHRVTDPTSVSELCPGLTLVEFAAVRDDGTFVAETRPADLRDAEYACGLYLFTKEAGRP
jgi:SAM-dependent methyltransferase